MTKDRKRQGIAVFLTLLFLLTVFSSCIRYQKRPENDEPQTPASGDSGEASSGTETSPDPGKTDETAEAREPGAFPNEPESGYTKNY